MSDTRISRTAQAAIKPIWEQTPQLLTGDTVTVAVQHIALARIDVQEANYQHGKPGKPRATVLNLYGTNDIDRLIASLQDARTRMQEEQDLLNQIMGRVSQDALATAGT